MTKLVHFRYVAFFSSGQPGACEAAHANGALFYPICPDREAQSWADFEKNMEAFLNGTYQGALEAANIAYFETLLPDEPDWK